MSDLTPIAGRAAQTSNRITGDRRWWALAAALIAMLFGKLDDAVVSTAMPTIIGELHGLSLYTWTVTAYILASAVSVPLYGRLSDMYGRKPFYVFGLVVFLAGSMLCGQAHSMEWLVAARALQGIGGGAMFSMPMATIGDIFDPKERGRWMGLFMGVMTLASLAGPALGGWITETLNWRWVFYINLPAALLTLGLVLYALPKVRTEERFRVDWLGAFLLACTLVPLLLALTLGGTTYAWGSWQEIGLFATAAIAGTAFGTVESTVEHPILPLHIFRNRSFTLATLMSSSTIMGMFAVAMFTPLYVQGVLGIRPTLSGFIMLPMMLAMMAASLASGQLISRLESYRPLAVTGGAMLVGGAVLFSRLDAQSSWTMVEAAMAVQGLGLGMLMPLAGTVISSSFSHKLMGTASAVDQTLKSLAGAISTALLGPLMSSRFSESFTSHMAGPLAGMLAHVPQGALNPQALVSPQAQAMLHQRFSHAPMGEQLYGTFISVLHVALADATHAVFTAGIGFSLVTFALTWVLPTVRLKGREFYQDAETPLLEGAAPELRPGLSAS